MTNNNLVRLINIIIITFSFAFLVGIVLLVLCIGEVLDLTLDCNILKCKLINSSPGFAISFLSFIILLFYKSAFNKLISK